MALFLWLKLLTSLQIAFISLLTLRTLVIQFIKSLQGVPHRIWIDMCGAFQVEELALMIRAARGRSRRPNHMCSHLDALQAMTLVNLRRVPHHSHSVAQQASFYIAFGTNFQEFWRLKWIPKFDF